MQKSARLIILIVGGSVAFLGAGSVSEAASIHQFDVGYGWDGAFAYGQAELLPPIEARPTGELVDRTLEVSSVAAHKTATVPVPGSLVLFGSGLLLLALAGRRSRRRTSGSH